MSNSVINHPEVATEKLIEVLNQVCLNEGFENNELVSERVVLLPSDCHNTSDIYAVRINGTVVLIYVHSEDDIEYSIDE